MVVKDRCELGFPPIYFSERIYLHFDLFLQTIGARCRLLPCLGFIRELGLKVLKLPYLAVLSLERRHILVVALDIFKISEGPFHHVVTFLELPTKLPIPCRQLPRLVNLFGNLDI